MDLKKLISQMTLQQKLAQISQFNANCLHMGSSFDPALAEKCCEKTSCRR